MILPVARLGSSDVVGVLGPGGALGGQLRRAIERVVHAGPAQDQRDDRAEREAAGVRRVRDRATSLRLDDGHEQLLSEPQAEHDPGEDEHGDFAEGQEREHHEPRETPKGTFAEGQSDEDEHPVTPQRGDFARGQERDEEEDED